MTTQERADQLWFELNILLPPLPVTWSAVAVNEACTAMIVDALQRAIEGDRVARSTQETCPKSPD